ncbi:hypothetical protein E4U38_001999 [Claviceps purpurea]|nr:hypothetical protein E4U38_001999 [Claviceps purpurea]
MSSARQVVRCLEDCTSWAYSPYKYCITHYDERFPGARAAAAKLKKSKSTDKSTDSKSKDSKQEQK